MPPDPPGNTLAQRYGAAAAAEWDLIVNHFDLSDGFSLLILAVPDDDGVRLCKGELARFLDSLADLFFAHPEDLKTLPNRLLDGEAAACVLVSTPIVYPPHPEHEAWQEAWRHALAALNQNRNPLRRRWSVPLIFVGAPWLVPLFRDSAPDLWSVRDLVVRLQPDLRADWCPPRVPEPLAEAPPRGPAPDPDLALADAARLRGVEGKEAELAALLGRAAWGFHGQGQRIRAEEVQREAVGLYRELASSHPDVFRPDLAASLNNLAMCLDALGRREEAHAAGWEAVELYRELASSHPDAFRPDLAMSLNNLANTLAALGRREEAHAAGWEAVGLYRELATSHPDAFRPDLAGSLNNLANTLAALGRREEAHAAGREAVELYRELATSSPDAFRPDLAVSLNNLAKYLAALGRREEAYAAGREAVEIRRELASSHPDAFRPDLAMSLSVVADCLEGLGRLDEALALDGEAVAALAPYFQALPAAFAGLMQAILREYLRRCRAAGREPDMVLLAPLLQTFQQIDASIGAKP